MRVCVAMASCTTVVLPARVCVLSGSQGETRDRKLAYAEAQYWGESPFPSSSTVEVEIERALAWIAQRSPDDIMEEREKMIAGLEEADRAMRSSGCCQAWHEGVDDETLKVSGHTNGLLLSRLLEAVRYCDPGCALLLKEGRLLW